MTGLALSAVSWPDAVLERVTVDYDAVRLDLSQSTGVIWTVLCEGHIAIRMDGFWDEVIISHAELSWVDPVVEHAVRAVKQRFRGALPDSGSPLRNERRFGALFVHLSDGCHLEVVAARFTVLPRS